MSSFKDSMYDLYSFYDFWINEVAPQYFDFEDQDINKLGLFGYVNEFAAASLIGTSYAVSGMMSEIHPVKAKLKSTVYDNAALVKLTNFANATPSRISAVIGIKESDIDARSIQIGDLHEFILDRDTIINVDGINFMLDYDIKITIKKDVSNVYSVQYIMEIDNPYSSLVNPYLKTMTQTSFGDSYLFINVVLSQVSKQIVYEKNTTSNTLDIFTDIVDFDGEMAAFNVFYKESSSNEYEQIKVLYDGAPTLSRDEKFCYYSVIDSNRIQISFPIKNGYFKPAFNSDLKYELFTTVGVDGNFSYNAGQVEIEPKSEVIDYSNLVLNCTIISNAVGGLNKLGLDDIKKMTVDEMTLRGNIAIDKDLYTFFNKITDKSEMSFSKKRDDFIKREFSAFLLMRQSKDGKVIPTNTVSLDLSNTDFDVIYTGIGKRIIKTNSRFKRMGADAIIMDKETAVLTDAEVQLQESDPTKLLFGNPYTMIINDANLSVSYYLNNINSVHPLDYEYGNSRSIMQFIVNEISVVRDTNDTYDKYKIGAKLTLNSEAIVTIATQDGAVVTDYGNLKVKGIIMDGDKSIFGYCDFSIVEVLDNGAYIVESEWITDEYLESATGLRMTDSLYAIGASVKSDISVPISDLKIKLHTFIKYDSVEYGRGDTDASFPGMTDFTLTNTYMTSDNPISLLVDMNKLISSSVTAYKVNPEDIDYRYIIKSVPVVRWSYLDDSENVKEIISILNNKRLILEDSLEVIQNNFNIDFKFYNTYGVSKHFNAGTSGAALDTVQLKLSFMVKFKTETNVGAIKDYIRSYIETNDILTKDDRNFYIFSLISSMNDVYSDVIEYIQFEGINSYDTSYQLIEYDDATDETNSTFVPEYINIHTIKTYGTFELDIDIQLI